MLLIFDCLKQSTVHISEFGEILLFIIGGALFILITLFVSRFIRPDRPNTEKLSTYESGEEPVSSAWIQFNVRFYVIALIFLLFEVEIVFLFPWATVFADDTLVNETDGKWGWFALGEGVLFILILALGLIYAWVNGHLEWIKPEASPTDFKSSVPKGWYEKINQQYISDKTRK